MSVACRQEDGITHDRVSLAGKQTKRRRLSGGRTPQRDGARHRRPAHRVHGDPSRTGESYGVASRSEMHLRTDSHHLTRRLH